MTLDRLRGVGDALAAGVLLRGLGDGETYYYESAQLVPLLPARSKYWAIMLTWRERLPQLLGLVGVLEDEGVEVGLAADLELGLAGDTVLLDARSCRNIEC